MVDIQTELHFIFTRVPALHCTGNLLVVSGSKMEFDVMTGIDDHVERRM